MTYTMDRTYWRQSSTRSLIETALNSGNELAIALGERLQEYDFTEGTVSDLQMQIIYLEKENNALERRIETLEAELEALNNLVNE